MPQYSPAGKVSASEHAEINRSITFAEFHQVLDLASEAGLCYRDNRSVLRAIVR
jgi:uncharacterized Fe-S radical SAM superfamily protein PflX